MAVHSPNSIPIFPLTEDGGVLIGKDIDQVYSDYLRLCGPPAGRGSPLLFSLIDVFSPPKFHSL